MSRRFGPWPPSTAQGWSGPDRGWPRPSGAVFKRPLGQRVPIRDPVAFYNVKSREGWSDDHIRAAVGEDAWGDIEHQLQQESVNVEGVEAERLVEHAFRVFQALMGTSPAYGQKATELMHYHALTGYRKKRDRVTFIRLLLQENPWLARWIPTDQSMTRMKIALNASHARMGDARYQARYPEDLEPEEDFGRQGDPVELDE